MHTPPPTPPRPRRRLHVVSLPHTQTTAAFNQCAYTSKVRKFATMMKRRGNHVTLYASEENEAECDELVACISREQQEEMLGKYPWYRSGEIYAVDWDSSLPYWRVFNDRAIKALRDRLEPRDIICLITGHPARSIIGAFPRHQCVEYGIGYEGIDPRTHHVFESYAWMHVLYGKDTSADGRFYDMVIPNYFDVGDFPFSTRRGEYYLFMSRMTPRKGYGIAIDACERSHERLIIAGAGGDRPDSAVIEYVGFADAKRRGELLSHAQATFVPTLYVEPFGGVAVESMLCGTPVITTDWGAFPELVEQGVDGYRCRSMAGFVRAMDRVRELDYAAIRERAQRRFATEVIAPMYDTYFDRLDALWGEGFYAGV